MSSSPVRRIAVFLLAAVVASVVTRWLFGPAGHLPKDTLTRPWTATQVGMNGYRLETPWKLESVSMPFPSMLAGKLRDPPVYYGHTEDAGGVLAARFPIARGVPSDLDGAATGMRPKPPSCSRPKGFRCSMPTLLSMISMPARPRR